MKKSYKLLTAIGLCAVAPTAYASGYRSAVVEKTDGSTAIIDLEPEMTTRFDGDMLTFTGTGTSVEIPKSDLVSITFSETTGITDITASPSLTDGAISFTGLPAGSIIAVFDTAGRCLSSTRTTGGDGCLSLNSLPAGVYIVSVNGFSYKISVK